MTKREIAKARQRARGNLLDSLCARRNAFTIGWCAAFVQWGQIHVVQRAHFSEMRS